MIVTDQSNNTASVYLNNKKAVFTLVATLTGLSSPGYTPSVADLDGDGNLDLLVTNEGSNKLTYFLGKGAGQFKTGVDVIVGTQPIRALGVDADGDGRIDLAVCNYVERTIGVLLSTGQ